jgi:membrane protease YdiL (CAAX protease family)
MPSLLILPLVGKLSGVDYDVIADNTSNVIRGIMPMVGLGLAWGLLMAWRFGWLGAIFSKQPASAMPKFFWLIPAGWLGICLCRLIASPWADFDFAYLGVLAVAMVMVGFNEELLFRGILAIGARGDGAWSETRAMLISSLGFGLFHLPNLLMGQALAPTLIQIGYAFTLGLALFASMRLSRTILLPIAMHALWDFATFTSKTGKMSAYNTITCSVLMLTVVALLIALVIWSCVKKHQLIPRQAIHHL